MSGSRQYGRFEDATGEEEDDEDDAHRFARGTRHEFHLGAGEEDLGGTAAPQENEALLGEAHRSSAATDVKSAETHLCQATGLAKSDQGAILTLVTRLHEQNEELREKVRHLKGLASKNEELHQVVSQLKEVVGSYGFEESEIMNARPKKGKEGMEQLRYAPRDLFIIISMKFAEISAYYGGAYIYTNYFTEELGMSDQAAGNVYAAYGFISTVMGLFAGVAIDKLGVRRSLLIGTISSAIARFVTGATTSRAWAIVVSLTVFPLGGAFGVPVLALGIRRYSHKDNRKFAFSIFYTMLMLATLVGTMMINQIRGFFEQGMHVWGWHLSWMRIVWMMCTIFTLYTIAAAACLRDIQVRDDVPLEEMAIERFEPPAGSAIEVLKQITHQPRFWRLTGVSLIFCGVQMGFRHLDATFPKYMMRTYGPQAPWEVILSVNPVVTFFCTPLATSLLIRYKVGFRKALISGAFLSGFSPFFLAVIENYFGAVLWIVVMSLGQAIWGPKLYEYSTMSAPAGREGLFVAITASPIYLSSVPTGIISGALLQAYCPKNSRPEDKRGHLLWLFVGLTVCTSPILLLIFRRKLLKRGEDRPPTPEPKARPPNLIGAPGPKSPTAAGGLPTLEELSRSLEEAKAPKPPGADLSPGSTAKLPMMFGSAGSAWAGMVEEEEPSDDESGGEGAAPAAGPTQTPPESSNAGARARASRSGQVAASGVSVE